MFVQQEAETVKTEKDVGVADEGDSISMEPYKVYVPSNFSIEKYEPEVSHVIFRWFLWWLVSCVCELCVCMHARAYICVWVLASAC